MLFGFCFLSQCSPTNFQARPARRLVGRVKTNVFVPAPWGHGTERWGRKYLCDVDTSCSVSVFIHVACINYI
jgi:hypothetical protein